MGIGFSRKCITPPDSCRMAGFDLRTQPSEGVLDELYLSCAVLVPEKGTKLAFLSFDLLGLPREECLRIAGELKPLGFPSCWSVWISATHTHAAPSHVFGREGALDEPYLTLLRARAKEAVQEALESAEPCEAMIGTGGANGIASLRDVPRERSACAMPLFALKFIGARETLLARFSCHCTVLDETNLLISADLAGAARKALGMDAVLLNGACADLSTRYTRRAASPEELTRLGGELAGAIRGLSFRPADRRFRHIVRGGSTVELPQSQPLCPQDAERLRQEVSARLEECPDAARQRELRSILAVLNRPPRPREKTRLVDIRGAFLLGTVLIGLPFEMNMAFGADLEREMSRICGWPVNVICYTGGYDGYLPSGKPITAVSNYQDIASPYAPEAIGILYREIESMVRTITGVS